MITGGTGFIGSRLALKCLERGWIVKVIGLEKTLAESQYRNQIEIKGAEVIIASVTERTLLFELLKGVDIVYHLAAAQHEMNVADQRFWDVNVTGTENILEACVKAGVKRFVHGSTIGVYDSSDVTIDEQSLCNPDNIYGITKLEAEQVVLSFRDKIPVVVIRISETYGPGDRRLLKLFKAINRNAFFMIGKGANFHHLIYIDDLIEGLHLAASNENGTGHIFILAGMEPITTNDMVTVIAEQLGKKGPRFSVPIYPVILLATITEKILRPIGILPPLNRRRVDFFKKSYKFSNEKAMKILGFVQTVSFKKGITEMISWYRDMGYL